MPQEVFVIIWTDLVRAKKMLRLPWLPPMGSTLSTPPTENTGGWEFDVWNIGWIEEGNFTVHLRLEEALPEGDLGDFLEYFEGQDWECILRKRD